MAEELQSLIERINRDGVAKAKAEADQIVAAAKEQAAGLVREARAEAERHAAAAKEEEKAAAARAEETLRQAARDAVIAVERAVERLLENVLSRNVDAALADPATAAALVADAVRGLVATGEISAGPKIADALRSQLAAQRNLTVVLDETLGTGFKVSLEGGRIEHDFTGGTVAAELAKRLRPDLAKLMRDAEPKTEK